MIGFDQKLKTEIFDKMDRRVKNIEVYFDGQDTYFRGECWKWLPLTMTLELNGALQMVDPSDLPSWDYMIAGEDWSHVTEIKLKQFTWFTGTYRETNTDFTSMGNDESSKLPMVWLSFTPIPTSRLADVLSPIGYTHSFSMFFCASAYFREFTTENHMRTRVDNLEMYVHEFIKTIEHSQWYETGSGLNHSILRYPKFGTFSGSNSTSILDSQLSAIELSLELPELKDCYC